MSSSQQGSSGKSSPENVSRENSRSPSPLAATSSAPRDLQHMPAKPSRLREAHEPPSSPDDRNIGATAVTSIYDDDETGGVEASGEVSDGTPFAQLPKIDTEFRHTPNSSRSSIHSSRSPARAEGRAEEPAEISARTYLLQNQLDRGSGCGLSNCNHGTFSPRPATPVSRTSFDNFAETGFGASYGTAGSSADGGDDNASISSRLLGGIGARKMKKTQLFARQHGIRHTKTMYLTYYIPFFNWIRQYKWSYLRGDIIAALTMASFYLPMSLSYASNLGHIPPINGLYSFVFNPLVYALLGTSPQMVVGPEAAGSLLVGTVVTSSVELGHSKEEDDMLHAQIAGLVTGMAGAIILVAGLTRLGFLDSVLSRPFLRGFISAVGFVILVDQLIPEMGLSAVAREVEGVTHGSSLSKLIFLFKHAGDAHGLTCAVAFGSFTIIMVCRELKKRLQPRFPSVAYVPDRFLVVVLSAVFTWRFRWDKKGLSILGDVSSSTGAPFPFHWPFQTHVKHIQTAMGTSFVIALLGFFESSVAAKSLTGSEAKADGIQGMSMSANRELVALGVANIIGGLFMALPAFGGYGRSKVNAATGGRTPMSSIVLSILSIICVLFIVPYFHYLPKAVLSSMISVVAYSLIEEAPHDIRFFLVVRGWSELSLMALIFLATIFYSLTLGIAVGIGLSLVRVIKHSTRPRIQILGRIPGTTKFENAELDPEKIEFIEGCLIVKIPEPLTFANTGELKTRLRRLEMYGSTLAHPALPRVRNPDHNKNIIFDVHGVTSLDAAGAQILAEIVDSYLSRNVRVFFCRVPHERSPVFRLFERSGIVDKCGRSHFVMSVDQALSMTEMEELEDHLRQRAATADGPYDIA
ncbi:hypothetical protein L228DRAFT_260198 [Xylona heveae TC161]|uniref:STAS domain-containing protein n=1 Tax=Xylona heveae (strain CBS 132557 / TC161) TaxID=1328760 RepID=A0A165HDV1_XYLHT|nr:hypothetical protein L228DRAFT_260198 [Xylona heveae TC161]KZF23359.1 hypothetical protein L228DRAFT_260198 [Xylona heveae TC161]